MNPPPQCGFAGRCDDFIAGKCDAAVPSLVELHKDHFVRCYLHSEESEPVYA